MKARFLRQQIQEELGTVLQPHGFRYKKAHYGGFVRPIDDGFHRIGFRLIDYEPEFFRWFKERDFSEYVVHSETEVRQAAADMKDVMTSELVPFLDRHVDLRVWTNSLMGPEEIFVYPFVSGDPISTE